MDVGYLTAFLAGVLALLSPCGALLLPSYFSVTFSASAPRLVTHTAIFYAGLVTTLAPLGAGAAWAGRLLVAHRGVLITVSGALLIVLGALQILGRGFDLRRLLPRALTQSAGGAGAERGPALTAFVLGMVSGVAGFCTGPILGAVLTLAASSGSPLLGASMMAVHALGLALPLVVIAAVWSRLGARGRSRLRGRTFTFAGRELHTMPLVSGLVLIVVGVLFLTTNGLVDAPGMVSTRTASELQNAAVRLGSRVDDTVLIVVGALVALAAWGVAMRRTRSVPRRSADEVNA